MNFLKKRKSGVNNANERKTMSHSGSQGQFPQSKPSRNENIICKKTIIQSQNSSGSKNQKSFDPSISQEQYQVAQSPAMSPQKPQKFKINNVRRSTQQAPGLGRNSKIDIPKDSDLRAPYRTNDHSQRDKSSIKPSTVDKKQNGVNSGLFQFKRDSATPKQRMSMLFNINMPKLSQKTIKSNQSKSQQRDTAKSQSIARNKDQVGGATTGMSVTQKKFFTTSQLNPVLKKKNQAGDQNQKPLKELVHKLQADIFEHEQTNDDLRENLRINKESLQNLIRENNRLNAEILFLKQKMKPYELQLVQEQTSEYLAEADDYVEYGAERGTSGRKGPELMEMISMKSKEAFSSEGNMEGPQINSNQIKNKNIHTTSILGTSLQFTSLNVEFEEEQSEQLWHKSLRSQKQEENVTITDDDSTMHKNQTNMLVRVSHGLTSINQAYRNSFAQNDLMNFSCCKCNCHKVNGMPSGDKRGGSLINLNRTPGPSNPLKINIRNIARPYQQNQSEVISENRRQTGNMTPNHLYDYSEKSQMACHTPLNGSFEEIKEEEKVGHQNDGVIYQAQQHEEDDANARSVEVGAGTPCVPLIDAINEVNEGKQNEPSSFQEAAQDNRKSEGTSNGVIEEQKSHNESKRDKSGDESQLEIPIIGIKPKPETTASEASKQVGSSEVQEIQSQASQASKKSKLSKMSKSDLQDVQEPEQQIQQQVIEELQKELTNIEQSLNREQRITQRKTRKLEQTVQEHKHFLKQLQELYTLPDKVNDAINDIFEKFDDKTPLKEGETGVNQDDILNDSALYLSSNWSTGGGGCIRHYQMFYNEKEKEKITQHEQLIFQIPIPQINIQIAIDLPPSSSRSESVGKEPSETKNDNKKTLIEQKIDLILLEDEQEQQLLALEAQNIAQSSQESSNFAVINGLNHQNFNDLSSNEDADFGLDNILGNDDPFLSELGNILNEEGDLDDPFYDDDNNQNDAFDRNHNDLKKIMASCSKEKDFFNVGDIPDNSMSQRESAEKKERLLDEFRPSGEDLLKRMKSEAKSEVIKPISCSAKKIPFEYNPVNAFLFSEKDSDDQNNDNTNNSKIEELHQLSPFQIQEKEIDEIVSPSKIGEINFANLDDFLKQEEDDDSY